jgi:uncharacterized protein (DUF488 family)
LGARHGRQAQVSLQFCQCVLVERRSRAYADHMASEDFSVALGEVVSYAMASCTALLCAEALCWRCHRRLIADPALLLVGCEVLHIDPKGELDVPRPTASATRVNLASRQILVYPSPEGTSLGANSRT